MRTALMWAVLLVGLVSLLLGAGGVWLILSGRNLPGVLGRGFTRGDDQRLKRAPAVYYRALGAFAAVSALDGFFLAWVISLLPTPPIWSLAIVSIAIAILAIPTTAAFVWLFVLASRYRLFRWDKP